jgi:2-polyprenyl-3-methyl-5-hydroxy-6-metoxy-1,4-benzoquinol methylase
MSETGDIEMWNAAAERYEAVVTNGSDWHQRHVINPAVLKLIGQVTDQDILDSGCGPGWLSVELARRRARAAILVCQRAGIGRKE